MFPYRRDVTTDIAKDLGSFQGAEGTRDLLFDLDHPHISLGEIVINIMIPIN